MMRYTGKKRFTDPYTSTAEQIRHYKRCKKQREAWGEALKPRKAIDALRELMRGVPESPNSP